MEQKKITFLTDKVFVKAMRSDKSFRVELDTGEYEIDAIKELMSLPDGVYKITVEASAQEYEAQ